MQTVTESRTKLMGRNFFLLWQGQFVSQIGNNVYAVAMVFWIAQATNSAAALGLLMMLSTLPAALVGPLGGTLADRHSRRRIIIFTDILCGLAVLGLAAMLFTSRGGGGAVIPALFAVSLLIGVLGTVFRPAISASIPDIVPHDKVMAANSVNQTTVQLSQLIGQGIGGVLFRVLGAPVLFLVNGLSYLFAAFSESFVEIPQRPTAKSRGWAEVYENYRRDTAEGFRHVRRTPGMWNVFFAIGFLNFFLVPVGLLLPFYVSEHLKSPTDWYGFMVAGLGAGAVVGSILAGVFGKLSGAAKSRCVVLCLLLASAFLGLLGASQSRGLSLLLLVLAGVASGFINVTVVTVLQLRTPTEIRGRIFGLLNTLTTGLTPVAMGLAGVVADLTGRRITLIYAVCGGVTALLTIAVALSGNFRRFLAYEQAPAVQVPAGAAVVEGAI